MFLVLLTKPIIQISVIKIVIKNNWSSKTGLALAFSSMMLAWQKPGYWCYLIAVEIRRQ
jgi:hypothetical protein